MALPRRVVVLLAGTVALALLNYKFVVLLPDEADPKPTPLVWGDLPGYTGWPRPPTTLASGFVTTIEQSQVHHVGQNVTFVVHHPQSQDSLFYARAYGPAILPGRVLHRGDGTHAISFGQVVDPGTYTVEVVLTYSRRPSRRPPSTDEPAYEGWLLPGFPRKFTVTPTSPFRNHDQSAVPRRPCHWTDFSRGRWVVTERLVDRAWSPAAAGVSAEMDRPTYSRGMQTLGFVADYRIRDCEYLSNDERSREALLTALQGSNLPQRPLEFVFVGDSNTRIQAQLFRESFGVPVTYIATNGGLVREWDRIEAELKALRGNETNRFVLFNTGLHSIFELCDWGRDGRRRETLPNLTSDFSCHETYREYLQRFVDLVLSTPAILHAWQTTMAAWPKWGVPSAAWPWTYQHYPLDISVCEEFNQIAAEVLPDHVPVLDTYWLTYSRPDHRQVDEKNSVTGRLMHAGPEVYSVLTRQWAHVVLETIRAM